MSDLVTWLRGQLDEDKRMARLAAHGRDAWVATSESFGPQVRTTDDEDGYWLREFNAQVWQCEDEDDGCPDMARSAAAEGEHIARHDPARVLAEVAAKRAILDDEASGRLECPHRYPR